MSKTYFASDFHLGIDGVHDSLTRERLICDWLDQCAQDASAIYLVGDIFDFWFEYKRAIPKGYIRFFGKLAELRDANIPIYAFTGNHDMWLFDYLPDELGIPVYRDNIIKEINGKQFLIGHGDGKGPGDLQYKLLKKFFASPLCQWLYARIHPNSGIKLAEFLSKSSRDTKDLELFKGAEKEWLIHYCERKIEELSVTPDYFVFGHRHLPIDYLLSNQKSHYINLGDWLRYTTYAEFDSDKLELKVFDKNQKVTIYPTL